MNNINIDSEYLTKTLVDLVQINSINPSLAKNNPGEGQIGAYLLDAMRMINLDATVHELAPSRVNVVGRREGTGGGRSLMLNAHMDTVGVEGMEEPFSGEIRDGRVYGRGSQDMKGSLAAMMTAAKAIDEAGVQLKGDLILTAVADEEYTSMGTEDILRHYKADSAIVTEPTDLSLCLAHRGFIWFEVETYGRAAHGSRFKEGIDAIMLMGHFLDLLDQLEKELRQRIPHPLAGPPSLHAAQIEGGTEISVYAANCILKIERRTSPGETIEAATAEIQSIIDQLTASVPNFRATVKPTFARSPFETESRVEIVNIVEDAVMQRTRVKPKHVGATFWTDAALLAEAGIETVLLGPVGGGLHSAEEWVDLPSVIDLAHILAKSAIHYCN